MSSQSNCSLSALAVQVPQLNKGEKGRRGGGGWLWELPDAPPGLTLPHGHVKDSGNVNNPEARKEGDAGEGGNLNGVEV